MRRVLPVWCCALLLLLAAFVPVAARQEIIRLDDLASAWSGGTTPTCADSPGMADLPPVVRTEDCTWAPVGRDAHFSQVTANRSRQFGLTLVNWERRVADSAVARTLADSLGTNLRARGLREYACPNSGRRWQAPGIVVQFTRGAVFPDGLLRVAVFATTWTDAMPEMACPGVPKLPRVDRAPVVRRSAD